MAKGWVVPTRTRVIKNYGFGPRTLVKPLLSFDGRTNEMPPLPTGSAEDAKAAFTGTGHAASRRKHSLEPFLGSFAWAYDNAAD
jgi:hypothetical protein